LYSILLLSIIHCQRNCITKQNKEFSCLTQCCSKTLSQVIIICISRPKKNDKGALTRPTLIICHDPKFFWCLAQINFVSPTSDPNGLCSKHCIFQTKYFSNFISNLPKQNTIDYLNREVLSSKVKCLRAYSMDQLAIQRISISMVGSLAAKIEMATVVCAISVC